MDWYRISEGKVGIENPAPVLPAVQGFSFDKFQSGPMGRTSVIFCFLFCYLNGKIIAVTVDTAFHIFTVAFDD